MKEHRNCKNYYNYIYIFYLFFNYFYSGYISVSGYPTGKFDIDETIILLNDGGL